MRKVSSMEFHAVHFFLAYLSVSVLISLTFGSLNTVTEVMCEYEDANLVWRNTPKYSLSDVKAMAWYKGKGSLIATWLEGKEFTEYPLYIGRLMQIGQNGIKIRTANRSDSGIYWLSLTLASVDRKLEALTYLEVKDMRTNPEPGEYVACTEGESATCYMGNISDLCSTYTTPTSDHGLLAVVIPLFIVVVLTAIVLLLCRQRIRCRKPSGGLDEKSAGMKIFLARNKVYLMMMGNVALDDGVSTFLGAT